MDYLAMYCLSLLGVVWILYSAIIVVQYMNLQREIYRQQVLNIRIALCLPLYSLIFYLSLYFPDASEFLHVVIVIVEGITLATFFSLLVENVGGSTRTLFYLNETGGNKSKACKCLYPEDVSLYYQGLIFRLYHCILTRTIVAIVCAVLISLNLIITRIMSTIFNVLSTLILLSAVFWLINLCKYFSFIFN